MEEKSNITTRLQEALDQNGMSPAQLSKLSGISRPQISEYLRGKCKPKQDKIFLLAKSLNVSPSWLMGYNVEMVDNDFVKENIKTDILLSLWTEIILLPEPCHLEIQEFIKYLKSKHNLK